MNAPAYHFVFALEKHSVAAHPLKSLYSQEINRSGKGAEKERQRFYPLPSATEPQAIGNRQQATDNRQQTTVKTEPQPAQNPNA